MRSFKHLLLSASAAVFLLAPFASANLGLSSISAMKVKIYGFYTSSDPTCQTGLSATIPISNSPQTMDLTQSPTMGDGPVSTPINCIVIVMANSVITNWSAGTYTTSTSSGGGTYSDSVCDAGGSNDQNICQSGTSLSWPSTISAGAATAGVTLPSSCTGTDSDIIPLYLSTYSSCTGQTSSDSSNPLCMSDGGTGPDSFVAPTGASSVDGIKLTSISSVGSKVYMAINPDKTVGGTHSGCSNISPPTTTIHQ